MCYTRQAAAAASSARVPSSAGLLGRVARGQVVLVQARVLAAAAQQAGGGAAAAAALMARGASSHARLVRPYVYIGIRLPTSCQQSLAGHPGPRAAACSLQHAPRRAAQALTLEHAGDGWLLTPLHAAGRPNARVARCKPCACPNALAAVPLHARRPALHLTAPSSSTHPRGAVSLTNGAGGWGGHQPAAQALPGTPPAARPARCSAPGRCRWGPCRQVDDSRGQMGADVCGRCAPASVVHASGGRGAGASGRQQPAWSAP